MRTLLYSERVFRVLLALVLLVVLGNLGFALVYARTTPDQPVLAPYPATSDQLVLVAPLDGQRVLAATRADELLILQGGRPVQRAKLDTLITAVAAAPDGKTMYAGTAAGKLALFDGSLAPLRELQISGRIVGLEVTGKGELVVAHGTGVFSDQYFVSLYPAGAEVPTFTTQAEFTISGLELLDDQAVYGTTNARLGSVDTAAADGPVRWTALLDKPVTRLLGLPERNLVLVGTESGQLELLNREGARLGQVQPGRFPIRSLAYDAANRIFLVGDSRGYVYALNEGGELLFSRLLGNSDTQAVVPGMDGHWLAIPREGQWQQITPSAIRGQQQAAQLVRSWLVSNGVALGLLLIVAMAAFHATRRVVRRVWQGRLAYALLFPGLALIALFNYYPTATAIYYSLTNFSLRNVTEYVGLANYRQILTRDVYFRVGLGNMVIITLSSILKTITVPLLIAELIYWLRSHVHQYVFRTLFVLPTVVPGLVFTLLWQQVYDPNLGLLNQLLRFVGLGAYQRAWLGDENTALWAVIGVGFPWVDAFAFLILLGGLLNINGEYFDAAKIDGAGRWRRFRHIDLPLLVPQLRLLLFFAVTGTIQGFAGIFILTRGGPGTATYIPALQMYLRIADGDFGYASAIGVVLFAMILLTTYAILRFRRQSAIETV